MTRKYRYVGPDEIRLAAGRQPTGHEIREAADVERWIAQTGQEPAWGDCYPVTFVIGCDGLLRIASRHSEHVACAGGEDVLAAGELVFCLDEDGLELSEASNQSTGFCPEPDSWTAVQAALEQAGIPHPGGYTREMVFRRCPDPDCGQRNIVKEGLFECGVCGTELPAEWNFGR